MSVKKLDEQEIIKWKDIPDEFPTNKTPPPHNPPSRIRSNIQKEEVDKKEKVSERQTTISIESLPDTFKMRKHNDRSSSKHLEIAKKL